MSNLKLEGQASQRFGQLIVNAVVEYLKDEDRYISDEEAVKCLFYLSDHDLNIIVSRYIAVLNARNSI